MFCLMDPTKSNKNNITGIGKKKIKKNKCKTATIQCQTNHVAIVMLVSHKILLFALAKWPKMLRNAFFYPRTFKNLCFSDLNVRSTCSNNLLQEMIACLSIGT